MQHDYLSVLIRQVRLECSGVVSIELEASDGAPLPGYAAGAHVNVRIPGGPLRSYSLIDPAGGRGTWRIAVKHEPASRGGSRWFHDVARVGMLLEAAPPENDFALVPAAPLSVFVAGGIGITPLLSMIGTLAETGRPWELHYAAASSASMPFQNLLGHHAARGDGRVLKHFSDAGHGRLDLRAIVASTPDDAHLYCCGPAGMIDDFLVATADRDPETVHHERFAASQVAVTDGGFSLQLARDGRLLEVPAGKSILDVLLDAGVDVPYSCSQGVCGTCRLVVLDGEPEHRDDFLTDEEKAANDAVIACCSGSRSQCLVVDL